MTFPASRPKWLTELLRLSLPLAILGAGIGGFMVLAARKEPPATVETARQAPLVSVVVVQRYTEPVRFEVDGVVVPFREVEVAAEVPGIVQHKSPQCRAGAFVTRGTLLLQIDPREYEIEVRRLTKELEQTDVNLQELEVELQNTLGLIKLAEEDLALQRREMQRLLNLAGSRVVTESELDTARRAELAARNTLLTLRNQQNLLQTRRGRWERARELIEVQLDRARLDLQRTQITAPLDGVIVRDLVEQDGYVQKGAVLLAIDDISAVEVRCNLRMDDLFWLRRQSFAGQPAVVASDVGVEDGEAADDPRAEFYRLPPAPVTVGFHIAGRTFEWDGVLSRYDGIGLDERTRLVPCRVLVPDPRAARVVGETEAALGPIMPPTLVRGMYVTLTFELSPAEPLLALPERAVRPGNVVWRVDQGRLSIDSVPIARLMGDTVLIHAGQGALREGDRVVVSPLSVAIQGMAVREQNE